MRLFLKSFVWAGRGIIAAVLRERNFRFHLCSGAYVIFFASFYAFSLAEKVLLAVLITGVLALELLNSAIEGIVDMVQPEPHVLAGRIKDIAAGAVLVFCIGAAVCGVLLFWDADVIQDICNQFLQKPWSILLLVGTIAASAWFVFGFGKSRKANNAE